MLRNQIILFLRLLKKNKLTSFINLLGLSLSIAVVIILCNIVFHEFSFENFNENRDRIFRFATNIYSDDGSSEITNCLNYSSGKTIKYNFVEVSEYTSIQEEYYPLTFRVENESYIEKNVIWADKNFFNIFNYNLGDTDKNSVLEKPNSIVITEKNAIKLFGSTDVKGKIVKINNNNFFVTGIIKGKYDNSHLVFDYVLSMSSYNENVWKNQGLSYKTYFLLNSPDLDKETESRLNEKNKENVFQYLKQIGSKAPKLDSKVEKLEDIHLYGADYFEKNKSNIYYVWFLVFIVVIITIISFTNYVNLSVSTAETRRKEIGIKKVSGIEKRNLFNQFITESIFTTLIAFTIGSIFVVLFKDTVNSVFKVNLSSIFTPVSVLIMFIAAFATGAVAGLYPAAYLSNINPVDSFNKKKKKVFVNKFLVVVQFFITIVLVTNVITGYNQITYLQNKSNEFSSRKTLILKDLSGKIKNNSVAFANELKNSSQIRDVAFSINIPGDDFSYQIIKVNRNGKRDNYPFMEMFASPDYFHTLGIPLVKGEEFKYDANKDYSKSILINESAAKLLGFKNPVGKIINISNLKEAKIEGVVSNFHFETLRNNIKPLFVRYLGYKPTYVFINSSTENLKEFIEVVKKKSGEFDDDYRFTYTFLDEYFEKVHGQENDLFSILISASLFTIIISVLGLFALTYFVGNSKQKEISIKKIHGASTGILLNGLLRESLNSVILGIITGLPVSYFLIKSWLSFFAYRTNFSLTDFVLGIFIILTISVSSILPVLFNALKKNPVEVLRNE